MRKIIAIIVLVAALGALAPVPAHAGGGTAANVALGLASFAVFNQIVGGVFAPRVWGAPYYGGYYSSVVYAAPPPAVTYYAPPGVAYGAPVTYAAPPPATYAPAPAPVRNEVVYAHGRYVLRGDGVTTAYQWVWIPNPPPPPPPPPAEPVK
jgi:hypothetical protein